jgi:hypothetical protein
MAEKELVDGLAKVAVTEEAKSDEFPPLVPMASAWEAAMEGVAKNAHLNQENAGKCGGRDFPDEKELGVPLGSPMPVLQPRRPTTRTMWSGRDASLRVDQFVKLPLYTNEAYTVYLLSTDKEVEVSKCLETRLRVPRDVRVKKGAEIALAVVPASQYIHVCVEVKQVRMGTPKPPPAEPVYCLFEGTRGMGLVLKKTGLPMYLVPFPRDLLEDEVAPIDPPPKINGLFVRIRETHLPTECPSVWWDSGCKEDDTVTREPHLARVGPKVVDASIGFGLENEIHVLFSPK